MIFKVADCEREMEQIHRLNYQTFVEEIPQHPPNKQQMLVDRFHEENTYHIALENDQVAAMLAVRGNRPFSLDGKLEDLEAYLPFSPQKMIEIRLLAVQKQHRNKQIFYALMQFTVGRLLAAGCDLAVISGTTRELRLYGKFGFVPFAELTGTSGAMYQPMYLTLETFRQSEAGRLFYIKS